MEKTTKWIIILGSASFFLRLSSYVIPEFAFVLLSTAILIALVVFLTVAVVVGFTKWRKRSKSWLLPSLVCLAFLLCSFYVASPTGRYISDKIFEKRFDDYARVVSDFRDGNILCTNVCAGNVEVIQTTNHLARIRDIWGTHCDDGGAIVLFRSATDAPLLHEGYMFKDYGNRSNCGKLFGSREFAWSHLPYMRHVTGNWYRFSDQPGF